MNQEIAELQRCLILRTGIEVWIDSEKLEKLETVLLQNSERKFVKFGNRIFNITDIIGIFTPQDIEDRTRRKNGEWQCLKGFWHEKFEKCDGHPRLINGRKVSEEEYQAYIKEHNLI